MCYDIEIIRKHQHKTSEWSGGSTTELYIYPKDAIYSERNFEWRLSSARVEVERSTFTSLQGISRIIMIIEGELLLRHEGHYNATLKALEQDSFSGEWSTTSVGKVIDFNLMMAKGHKGKLEGLTINKGEFKNIIIHNNVNDVEKFPGITEAFYIVKGEIVIDESSKGKMSLNQGDLALVTMTEKDSTSEFKIQNRSQEECKIIRASIFK